MKTKLLFYTLFVVLFSTSSFCQLTGTWALISNKSGVAGGAQSTAIAVGDVIPGDKFITTATHNTDGIKCQQSIGNWPNIATDSFHVDFPFSPNGSYDVTLSGITLTARTSGSSGANMLSLAVQANGAGSFTPLGTPQSVNTGGSPSNFNFGSLSLLLPKSSTYIIRMYVYAASSSTTKSRTVYLKNVVFTGTAVLPLKLLSFEARKSTDNKNTVELNWKTENEINTSNFVIEKSREGKIFYSVGNVSANNKGGVQQYSFGHTINPDDLQEKNLYYRLVSFDKDGKYTYSKVVAVSFKNNSDQISFYPNPARNSITIMSNGGDLQIFDITGKQVFYTKTIYGTQQINVSNLKQGCYWMKLNNSTTASLVIE